MNRLLSLAKKAYGKTATKVGNEAYTLEVIDGDIYIAFAGSDDLMDWKEDMDIKKSHINQLGLTVHHGFWNSMLECWNHIKTDFKKNYRTGVMVFITGHSKGSAMGFCLRLKLIAEGYPMSDIHFFGFATPRVLRTASRRRYLKRYSKNVILHEVQGDPVCNLPRTYMGYTPVYNKKRVAKMPWYKRIYLLRALNHKIETYVEKFG